MRMTQFVPSNVYGSAGSVNDTPPQTKRSKFPATSTYFMPSSSINNGIPSPLAGQDNYVPPNIPASTSQKSRQATGGNKFIPLLSDAMSIPAPSSQQHQTLTTMDHDHPN